MKKLKDGEKQRGRKRRITWEEFQGPVKIIHQCLEVAGSGERKREVKIVQAPVASERSFQRPL